MNDPWFEPNRFGWMFGAGIGVVGGTVGPLVGFLVPRGIGKVAVLGIMWATLAGSVGLLFAGLIAVISKQPYGVWYALCLPGIIGTIMSACLLPIVHRGYAIAEARRLEAQNLR